MRETLSFLIAIVVSAGLLPAAADQAQSRPAQPEHIRVRHILISFEGKLRGKNITRTQDEAKKLAQELRARIKAGEDFDALVDEYSDDDPPGIYAMANRGVKPRPGEYARTGMVAAFGDVGFKLKVGEVGLAEFHPRNSPYGYHIVKRIE